MSKVVFTLLENSWKRKWIQMYLLDCLHFLPSKHFFYILLQLVHVTDLSVSVCIMNDQSIVHCFFINVRQIKQHIQTKSLLLMFFFYLGCFEEENQVLVIARLSLLSLSCKSLMWPITQKIFQHQTWNTCSSWLGAVARQVT